MDGGYQKDADVDALEGQSRNITSLYPSIIDPQIFSNGSGPS